MSDPDAAPRPPIFRPPPPPRHPSTVEQDVPAAAVPGATLPIATEPPSADVAPAAAAPGLPGEHRGGFSRLPTAPVGVAAPVDPEAQRPLEWAPPETSRPPRGLAGWALVFAIAGLAFALFVGWGFPIGLVAIVVGVVAVRRPIENRMAAVWAICLGAVSVLYSAGWLLWAATRMNLFG
ncbi:hypothetical protein [Microbacterium sp. CJ88]|uniref:hypothetical protein n=1 Tax=Microbacterium sp. CJ88 TaxID=3445672 RepID=UPI003F65C6D1